jgi:short-subunit dehydrogenase
MVRTPLFDHPSFENFSKFSTGISLSSETVAKAIVKASNSSRFEIVVPSVARAGIWFKQTLPYLINPIIGNAFRKQLAKRKNQD